VLKNSALWEIAIAAFLAISVLKLPFPAIIAAAALIGYVGGQYVPDKFKTGGGHGKAGKSFGAALIDDGTPTPPHARFSAARLGKVVLVGLLLWAVPMGVLIGVWGWNHTLTQMGVFFTKAALLTFGGAYAVLPYVYQGAVTHYAWLTPAQMIDGLALGETTPGPLIMVVAFVGFVGGFFHAALATGGPLLAGLLAAVIVTWFTFLPSFIFILAGGPLVESTHNDVKFTAPLTAITAAVVGVITNLALFFAYHVFWPQGFSGSFDWVSVTIAIAAGVALLGFQRNVIHVIAACGVAGCLVRLMIS
jgi:chromate transporter